ncbi:pathogenesis-related genes transcriptional activator PTI6-like [Cynara cardunculus var. scolymus]|uniref:pathogenesis-related genes transcriptional activator PTI6-like n=1 Tax=Cynara cardunculus var. scolymus TaxID=59895 RepID=UPI000D626517|nr:pathogenesis-related genes transcriptional activator PTI6-like [Cynara cardunculus var. scolymus]
MEDCFMFTPIKQTEHKRRITKEVPAMSEKFFDQEEFPFPKVIRISMTDPYATDSSEDEDDHIFERWCVKKYVNEINIQPSSKARMMPVNANMTTTRNSPCAADSKQRTIKKKKTPEDIVKKFRGVRKRRWGRWAAEIMDPITHQRLWLGTYDTPDEASMVYDNAAIKLCGAGAITNFVLPMTIEKPPPTNITSMSNHHPKQKSPKLPLADAPPSDYQSFDSIQLDDEVASFDMHHEFRSINPKQFDDFGRTPIAPGFIPETGCGSPSTLKIDNYFEDISDST